MYMILIHVVSKLHRVLTTDNSLISATRESHLNIFTNTTSSPPSKRVAKPSSQSS